MAKKREGKYEKKLSIKGSFDEVINVSVNRQPEDTPRPVKKEEKKEVQKKKSK